MKQILVNVDESKEDFFLELIGNLDFASIENSKDWMESLPDSAKESIEKGLDDFKHGRTYSHQEVLAKVNEKLAEYKKS